MFHYKHLNFLFKKIIRYITFFQNADGFLRNVHTIVKPYTFPCHHTCALSLVGDARVILNLQNISQREMPYTEHSHPGRDLERICSVRQLLHRGANKSLVRPTSHCILFVGENISFDASLVMYINSINILPIRIINRIHENQHLLLL
jgi:hypothetical protein